MSTVNTVYIGSRHFLEPMLQVSAVMPAAFDAGVVTMQARPDLSWDAKTIAIPSIVTGGGNPALADTVTAEASTSFTVTGSGTVTGIVHQPYITLDGAVEIGANPLVDSLAGTAFRSKMDSDMHKDAVALLVAGTSVTDRSGALTYAELAAVSRSFPNAMIRKAMWILGTAALAKIATLTDGNGNSIITTGPNGEDLLFGLPYCEDNVSSGTDSLNESDRYGVMLVRKGSVRGAWAGSVKYRQTEAENSAGVELFRKKVFTHYALAALTTLEDGQPSAYKWHWDITPA